jgi:hypothetical protein
MNNVGIIMDYLRHEFDFVILISHIQNMREQTDVQITPILDTSKGNNSDNNGNGFHPSLVKYPS